MCKTKFSKKVFRKKNEKNNLIKEKRKRQKRKPVNPCQEPCYKKDR
jgi:hypothetical protein